MKLIDALRVEASLGAAMAYDPLAVGRHLRQRPAVLVPFLFISIAQVGYVVWVFDHTAAMAFIPRHSLLALLVPLKTLVVLLSAAVFLFVLGTMLPVPISFRQGLSALTRCSYYFVLAEGIALVPYLVGSVEIGSRPPMIWNLSNVFDAAGLARAFLEQASLAAGVYILALAQVLKGMTGWSARASAIVACTGWLFLASLRVLLVESLQTILL
jgi:hypothetical protein